MRSRHIAVALLTALFLFTASAQTPPPPAKSKVRKLLELSGAGALGVQMMDGMIENFKATMPGVPEEFWTSFRGKVKPDTLIDLVIPVYEKHLSEADLDALIEFYSSPAGRRFVEKQPLILADTMEAGRTWGENLAKDVIEELKKKGYSKE